MDTVFSDWTSAINKFQSSVTADLEEIRKQKAEIQQLKEELFSRFSEDKYIRNDKRIILSAPEIVIGNVDCNGMLFGDSGTVIIRGGDVSIEGSGDAGVVRTRAATISQLAVDPGADGVQEAVLSNSTIISQAKNIVIQSNESEGYFSQCPTSTGGTGVRIHADETIEIEAAQSSELRSKNIGDLLSGLNSAKATLTSDAKSKIKAVNDLTDEMQDLLDASEEINTGDLAARSSVLDLDDYQQQFEGLEPALTQALDDCIKVLSSLAETNRRITALQDEQKKVDASSSTFKDATTGANLRIHGEIVDIESMDADGNVRTNPEASVNIQTGKLNINTKKEDGSLIDDSCVRISTGDVFISTVKPTLDENGNGDLLVDGSFHVISKDVMFEAVDAKLTNNASEATEQTKDSSFSVRVENMSFISMDKEQNSTGSIDMLVETMTLGSSDKDGNITGSFLLQSKDMTMQSVDKDQSNTGSVNINAENVTVASADKDGKALGQISVNGKNVFVKSVDTDDKGADKNLAAGGNMVLVAENMFVGRTDKDNTSKTLQISSDKTGIYGTTTAEVQQGEAKAVVQLDGGNIAISGSKAEFYGDNTVNGKTDFKSDATMTKLTVDNLEAKSSFKSTNISDGVAVPGAPSSAKLSAKLKEEDAPKPKVTETEEGGAAK